MKYLIIILITIFAMFNTSFWVFSEVYMHNGSMIDGLIEGTIVSSSCILLGFAIGKLMSLLWVVE
ncbi:MAG: hypothetical protein Unbinned5350contig1004_60 [Prokaryotic dsDNA virus sp.]|nr:MAG: hypothetical protein Unbinned5350contig1004_60 [Prokaryotic dsDNA virus sp.]|tara:strand:+ start:11673 stop:11867 length:195 start_codon:yes stop_codon:yes gene_type:complete